jgi:hypothetical protein
MELTWLGKAEARGSEVATRQAVERMRRVVLQLVAQRFGTVPTTARQRIEAIEDLEPLATLAERVLAVPSIAELGLLSS